MDVVQIIFRDLDIGKCRYNLNVSPVLLTATPVQKCLSIAVNLTFLLANSLIFFYVFDSCTRGMDL